MAHVVTAPCNDCKYTDCCVVCPVECFYQDDMMLYIGPVGASTLSVRSRMPRRSDLLEGNVPSQWCFYVQLNSERAAALKSAPGGAPMRKSKTPRKGRAAEKK
ncbi:MAG: ferredoxin [Gemmataceae bacterium]